jgi:hypothetical protein
MLAPREYPQLAIEASPNLQPSKSGVFKALTRCVEALAGKCELITASHHNANLGR